MQGLSQEIEAGIESILKGLALEIRLDINIKDPKEEFPGLVGYTTDITKNTGAKYSGVITQTNPTYLLLTYKPNKRGKTTVDEKIFYRDIKSARAYDEDSDMLTDDRMTAVIRAKTDSFVMVKDMLKTWVDSPNAPSKDKIRSFVSRLSEAGEKAIKFMRRALAHEIDYDNLEPHKVASAMKAKPVVLEGIFRMDYAIKELKNQLELDEFELEEKEFKIGYPERFGKGKFFPVEDYWKDWLNEEEDAVNICPHSTKGEIVTISDLKIQLPEVPKDKSKILFSDLPKEEQYWKRPKDPGNITPKNVDHYHEFILEEYRRRREGVHIMINGEVVYLTGHHYFALTRFRMLDDGEFMKYLEAQRDMFYHMEACLRDKRSLGHIFAKSRRTGFTYVVLAIMLNYATSTRNAKLGMTSKSGDDVQEVWAKFSYAFLNLPFWLRPVVKGKVDSNISLEFAQPSDNTKATKKSRRLDVEDYLNTTVDYRPTKNDSYDSVKLDMYLGDEAFKWVKPGDYIAHLGMVAPTMMPAGRVVGKAFIGSTMGAMAKGGEQGVELLQGSDVLDRDEITGKTPTALYRHFLPAQDNMFEFTDKYGKCWKEAPPEDQVVYNMYGDRIKIGSMDYLLAVEEQKRKQSDKALNEQLRTYPRNWSHVFRDDSEESRFNLHKIYQQLDHNYSLEERTLWMVGNFEWVDGEQDTKVVFRQNPMGRCKVSWLPSKVDETEKLANNVDWRNGLCYPLNGDLVRFGCDPYSLGATHGVGSKGALHGLTMKFPGHPGVPSNKFVVQYIHRPPTDIMFFEDVIKILYYYGAPALVESNRPDLLRHMRNRGYRHFALDRVDRPKNKLNDQERMYGGQMMSSKDIIDSHMNQIGAWIEDYVGVYMDDGRDVRPVGEMGDMTFNETLQDWAKFDPAPGKRGKHDATISSGLAIMACNPERFQKKTVEKKPIAVKTLVRKHKVKTW